jgi:hypothetical protein
MSDEQFLAPGEYATDAPLPNRFTRGTLLGCCGILCVLAMPILLFLPLERWALPLWLQLLVPLAAFTAAALGAWMLARMPAASPMRSHDPRQPLTGAGVPPLVERPARLANRLMVAQVALLLLICASGYVIASASRLRPHDLLLGVFTAGIAGILLMTLGLLIAGRRLPVPALRWVRVYVQSNWSRQGAPLLLMGLVWLAWALWVALGAGYAFGAGGLSLLTLLAVLMAPLAHRLPPRKRGTEHAGPPRADFQPR